MAWVLKRSIALGDKKKGRREGILNMKRARREGQRENACVGSISGMCLGVGTRAGKQKYQEKHQCPRKPSLSGPLPSFPFFLGWLMVRDSRRAGARSMRGLGPGRDRTVQSVALGPPVNSRPLGSTLEVQWNCARRPHRSPRKGITWWPYGFSLATQPALFSRQRSPWPCH